MKDFKKIILDNKITLYLYNDKNLKRSYVSYSVKFGSSGVYNEFYYQNQKKKIPFGLAHFLEHTLIEHSKYGNLFESFLKQGYNTNGVTYDNLTNYFFLGIDNIYESIEKLINMVDKPVFTKDNIEEVKYAILDELNAKYDSKVSVINSKNKRDLFKSFELSHKSNNQIGSIEDTKKITYEDVLLAYNAYYYNENKFLVIAGAFDENKLISHLNNIYKKIPFHKKEIKKIKYDNLDQIRTNFDIINWKTPTVDKTLVTYKMKNTYKMNRIKLDTYLSIYNYLKFDSDTDFSKNLIQKKLVNDSINASTDYISINDEEYILMRYSFESKNYKRVVNELKDHLNNKNLSKKRFNIIKKVLLVETLKTRDYIYGEFLDFPVNIYYTEKLNREKMIESLNYEELIKVVNQLKFDIFVTTVLKYDKNLHKKA